MPLLQFIIYTVKSLEIVQLEFKKHYYKQFTQFENTLWL